MSEACYRVDIEAFEGPLDLLLHLVKTNEVDIYHLPIARITDQYLEYLDLFEEMNLDVAGEYLVMAATLMYLKSRLLLPLDEEEEEEAEDPAVDLVRQLAEYQRYREASEALRDRALLDRDVFRRFPSPPEGVEPQDPGLCGVELGDLFENLRRVLAKAAARRPHTLEAEEYSVADAVRTMVGKLRGSERVEFNQLFADDAPRGFIIATFIGLLELLKLGILKAEQERRMGPVHVSLVERDVDDSLFELVESYGQGGTFRELGDEGVSDG